MDLDARKLKILQAIIDDYILTAAPVGSRTISKRSDINLSSATIRNEMSDLEELGYLDQPHTSAGRIPSEKAYRLYVNSIMRSARLSDDEIKFIRQHFSKRLDEVESVVKQTAWVLSDVTRYTSMVLSPRFNTVKLKHIQLVPVTEGKALAVIVTDAGLLKDTIIRIPENVGTSELEQLSRMLTKRLSNRRLDEVSNSLFNELIGEFREHRTFLNSITDVLQKSAVPAERSIELSGTTNILNYPEYSDMDKARSFFTALESKDLLYRMLTRASKMEFTVSIGSENEDINIRDCSIVTATYKLSDEPLGTIGVIGPIRMDYAKTLAILGYIGKSLSDILSDMLEED
jgi:heat-inducible transcriptional repressor